MATLLATGSSGRHLHRRAVAMPKVRRRRRRGRMRCRRCRWRKPLTTPHASSRRRASQGPRAPRKPRQSCRPSSTCIAVGAPPLTLRWRKRFREADGAARRRQRSRQRWRRLSSVPIFPRRRALRPRARMETSPLSTTMLGWCSDLRRRSASASAGRFRSRWISRRYPEERRRGRRHRSIRSRSDRERRSPRSGRPLPPHPQRMKRRRDVRAWRRYGELWHRHRRSRLRRFRRRYRRGRRTRRLTRGLGKRRGRRRRRRRRLRKCRSRSSDAVSSRRLSACAIPRRVPPPSRRRTRAPFRRRCSRRLAEILCSCARSRRNSKRRSQSRRNGSVSIPCLNRFATLRMSSERNTAPQPVPSGASPIGASTSSSRPHPACHLCDCLTFSSFQIKLSRMRRQHRRRYATSFASRM
mmetsp:Transcript_11469/g.37688  ORF Transcript_11469/g.37688 Transcript_11469/m.37688 type:complete len:411 (+) Transcript_11469:778-2010(+)